MQPWPGPALRTAASLPDFVGATLGVDDESKQGKRKMWLLLAIVLSAVVLFYWLAFMGTIWFCFNALMSLWAGHFVRAAIWACLGVGMLLWWQGTEIIPHPWHVDAWLKASAWVIGIGVLATFARFYDRHRRAAQAVPPFEPAPSEPAPMVLNINIELSPHADRRAVHDDLAALASALRGAIGTGQGPRRIPRPTIIDQ